MTHLTLCKVLIKHGFIQTAEAAAQPETQLAVLESAQIIRHSTGPAQLGRLPSGVKSK